MNRSPGSGQVEEPASLHIGAAPVAHYAAPLERSGGSSTFEESPGIACYRHSCPEVVSVLVWFLHDIDPIQAQYECKHLVRMVMQSYPTEPFSSNRTRQVDASSFEASRPG